MKIPHMLSLRSFATVLSLVCTFYSAAISQGAYQTGEYTNFFKEMGKSDQEITAKIDSQWNRMIKGVDALTDPRETHVGEHNYFELGDDMAYVKGYNLEIYSKGMGKAMLSAVQYGDRVVFNKLWKFVHDKMKHNQSPWAGYIAQKVTADFELIYDKVENKLDPAPKGSQQIVMALFFAANR